MRTAHSAGKITLLTLLSLVGVFVLASLFDIEYRGEFASVQATSTASTTVTVLNTPPSWTVTARELFASATSTPTNEGTSTWWTATAEDNNGENYVLVICKASTTIEHPYGVGDPTPRCGASASNMWGMSATTTSGLAATVSTTTLPGFNEKNDWYGYICDLNLGDPECNDIMYNGLHETGPASATSSPFVVNHAPTFTLGTSTNPVAPGDAITWTGTATDTTDIIRGGDNLRMFVCKDNNFNATLQTCLGLGGWATTSYSTTGTLATTTTLAIPTQDNNYDAYYFVIDEFGLVATGAEQGANNQLTVLNVAPRIGGATTFGLYDVFGTTTDILLALTVPEGETENFVVEFDVTDDNGCFSAASANEIQSIDLNVFRSGIGGQDAAGCDGDDTFNANQCYQDTYGGWTPTCYQKPGATCTGSTPFVTWECTFPLWFIADPTDVGSQHPTEYWMAAARATDDGTAGVGPGLTGAYGTSTTISEMTQFLSFSATGSPIAYGSFEPGFGSTAHPATTTVYATGNTGLDQYLSSDPMCVSYPNCSGSPTDTILTGYQHYSLTNTTLFWSGATTTASTSPTLLVSAIDKPEATTTPTDCTLATASCGNTYWGIFVPSSITFAGDYKGLNYIDAIISDQASW